MRSVACKAGSLVAAFCAALLLASQDARAVDECGTVSSSSTTATCPDQAYSSGIAYTGLTHAFTLDLPGGAATEITNPAAGSGIQVLTAPANTGDVALTVGASGDVAITASGRGSHGIQVDNAGSGDVRVTLSEGAAIASQYGAGLRIALGATAATAATARIAAVQGGAVSARRGLFAHVARSSAASESRASTTQPAIDVTWTGTFAREAGKTEASDAGRFAAAAIGSAMVVTHRAAVVEEVTRYGRPAGIEAQVMGIADLVAAVMGGDDPNALMSPDAQTALLTGIAPGEMSASPGTAARQAAIVRQFRKLVTATDFASITGASGVDANGDGTYADQEILDWLGADSNDRRTFLRDLLRYGLSEGEEKIIEALTTGGELDFTGLPSFAGGGWYGDAWEAGVRAFREKHNVGNIRIAVNDGAIDSRGDGIRAYYSTPHDDNGRIEVTVAAGATVKGGLAGVYVANAGCTVAAGCGPGGQGLRKQSVTVNGQVTGGADDARGNVGAAVHLSGGGTLTVGRTGELLAGASGQAIRVNDAGPVTIRIDGLVRGRAGARAAIFLTGGGGVTVGVNGRVDAGSTDGTAIDVGGERTTVRVEAPRDPREDQDWISLESADRAAARVVGLIVGTGTTSVTFDEFQDGVTTGHGATVPLMDGRPDTSGLRGAVYKNPGDPRDPMDPRDPTDRPIAPGSFDCDRAGDGRCRLYEALPSMLLSMNGLPSRDERSAAARDARGAWAHVHVGGGKWRAAASTRPDVAYEWRRFTMRAGIEAEAADGARAGVMVHVPRGAATMPPEGGEARLSGVGMGAYATALAGGFHLDVQATMTWFEVDLSSGIHLAAPLASDVSGMGYALGLEVGRRMAPAPDVSVSPRVSVTPRAGLVWSRVSLEDFTDSVGSRARVSVERAESLSGRIGVAVEAAFEGPANARLFASLDVAHAFSTEMETVVEGQTLRASAAPTSVRVGWGGVFDLGERMSLRAAMGYEAGGGHELGGDITLTVRF